MFVLMFVSQVVFWASKCRFFSFSFMLTNTIIQKIEKKSIKYKTEVDYVL